MSSIKPAPALFQLRYLFDLEEGDKRELTAHLGAHGERSGLLALFLMSAWLWEVKWLL